MKTEIDAQFETPVAPVPSASKLASAPARVGSKDDVVTDTQIQKLAFRLYEERGRVDGYDQQDWFEAQTILCDRSKIAG